MPSADDVAAPGKEASLPGAPGWLPTAKLGEVVPGLWCLPIELAGHTLGHVLTYALETPTGIVMVDTGWDGSQTLELLETRLGEGPGARLRDVVGIIATHGHPDHVGLADKVREASGAWLAMHPAEVAMMGSRYASTNVAVANTRAWLDALGAPQGVRADFLSIASDVIHQGANARADVLLTEGELAPIDGWVVRVSHTPGHTPGHICLTIESAGVVLAGDHILPTVFPTPLVLSDQAEDPLGDYLTTVRQAARDWEGALVLPGHGAHFRDAPAQARRVLDRMDQLVEETAALVGRGHRTAWDIAREMPWWGGWDSRVLKSKRAALGSTLACLRHLENRGDIAAVGQSPVTFEVAG